MELRASQPISALAASFSEFTASRSRIARRETQRRGPSSVETREEEQYWKLAERRGRVDEEPTDKSSGGTVNESPEGKKEEKEEKTSEGVPKEVKSAAEGKDTAAEGAEEAEEGRPLAGGPHRCGARRGQSAAA
ncbi:cilia- and flagella-associated protein 251-like [Colletes gigas]|uniref:cilia- and flagella-associated protein 251-like n=1 Tax=Colletes gigas TaxID=935657 RepID=UPI001C9B62B0|nr:cilia- and flagella-associated protein 251-like [Colletes gigas]